MRVRANLQFINGPEEVLGIVISQEVHAGVTWFKIKVDEPLGKAKLRIFKVPEMNVEVL